MSIDVASGLDLHILKLCKVQLAQEPPDEEAPTELDTIHFPVGIQAVSKDELSVRYIEQSLHRHTGGLIVAKTPVPQSRSIYYFEIYVKNAGENKEIEIGFIEEEGRARLYLYNGEDGSVYREPTYDYLFAPTFTNGDVVGAGVNRFGNKVFFTKNGKLVKSFFHLLEGPIYPIIGIHSENAEVHVNFGQKQFAYNVQKHESQLKKEERKFSNDKKLMVDKIVADEEPLSPSTVHGLVHSYFLHSGYEETLKAFTLDCEHAAPRVGMSLEGGFIEQDLAYELNERKTIRQLIRNGEIDASLSKLQDLYPQVLEAEYSAACFLLHYQKFIELVRAEKLPDADMYGKEKLKKYHELSSYNFLTKECFALLAYKEPPESSVECLLDNEWRDILAEAVNAAILDTNPDLGDQRGRSCSFRSYLETLLLHLRFCLRERENMLNHPRLSVDIRRFRT